MKNAQASHPYHEIVKGTGVVVVGSVMGVLLNYFFKVLVARWYGPTGYGLFSIGGAVITVVSTFALMGMHMGIARFVPFFMATGEYGKLKSGIANGMKLVAVVSLCIGGVLFFAAPVVARSVFADTQMTAIIRMFLLSLPFGVVLNYVLGIVRGLKRMSQLLWCNDVLSWIVRISVLAVLFMCQAPILYAPITYIISSMVVLVVAYYFYMTSPLYRSLKTIPAVPATRELFAFSLPLTISNITGIVRKRFDIILVGCFLSARDAGLYNVAVPIGMTLLFFLNAVNRIIMPVAADLFGTDQQEQLRHIYKRVATNAVVLTFPIFALLIGMPTTIITLLFGTEYVSAAPALQIIAVGYFINVATGSFGETLQSIGATKQVMWISLGGSLTNLVGMVLLIPRFGITGAASAITISLVVMSVMGVVVLQRLQKINCWSREYGIVMLLGSGLVVAVWFSARVVSWWPLIILTGCALCLYGFALGACKVCAHDVALVVSHVRVYWQRFRNNR